MNYQPVPDPSARGAEKKGGVSPALIVGLVVLAALLIFIFQNTDDVEVSFLFFDFSAPLWLILLAVAVLGGLLDGVVARAYRRLRGKEPKPKT
jgi:uncharacterized integral membrane protein